MTILRGFFLISFTFRFRLHFFFVFVMTKYIIVSGGVISGIGKGVIGALHPLTPPNAF